MPAPRAKRSTRRTPARRKRVRKTIVTLKPLGGAKDENIVAASSKGAGGTARGNEAQAKIEQLEAEIRQLKVQLAEQRNSSTTFAAPMARPERSYRGLAITFAVTTIVLLVVVVVILS